MYWFYICDCEPYLSDSLPNIFHGKHLLTISLNRLQATSFNMDWSSQTSWPSSVLRMWKSRTNSGFKPDVVPCVSLFDSLFCESSSTVLATMFVAPSSVDQLESSICQFATSFYSSGQVKSITFLLSASSSVVVRATIELCVSFFFLRVALHFLLPFSYLV